MLGRAGEEDKSWGHCLLFGVAVREEKTLVIDKGTTGRQIVGAEGWRREIRVLRDNTARI